MHFDLDQAPRLKRPSYAQLDEITIQRAGESAWIIPNDPTISSLSFHLESPADDMTDQDILDAYNAWLKSIEELRAADPYFAEEVPKGRQQIEYFDGGDQWCPLGSVLRCVISDGGPDYEISIWIDDRHLSLAEFGRLLAVHNGWGMRITFVPDDELEKQPEIRRWRRRKQP